MKFLRQRHIPASVPGLVVTLLVIGAIEVLVRTGILNIPNPAALALIAVIYAGYSGGSGAGLSSAAFAILYGLYFFSAPGAPLRMQGDDATRFAVLALAAPFIAWLTGTLKDRAERALRQKIEAQRIHAAELERAERGVRHKEARLRALIDALPAYVAYVDRNLRIRFHNKAYEEWIGLPASFIDGREVAEVIGKELFESGTRQAAEEALAGRTSVFERVQTDLTGKRSVAEAHLVPDFEEDGTVAGFFAMLFDVSRHKEAEARITRLSERLRRALAGSRLVLWELNLRTGMVQLGREWAQIIGGNETLTELHLTDLRQRVHPEDRAGADDALQSVIERRAVHYDIEHRVQALDGDWKWVRSTGRAVEFDANGRPLRLSGTNRDITRRKQDELALRESETRLRLVTDAVPAMIVYVDAELRYRFVNRRYRETMVSDEAQILGRTVREVIGESEFEVSRPWLERALAGEQVEHERKRRWPDGRSADLSVTYVPHVGSDGAVGGVYALLVDLTERKRAERIKERFISMVSHELRTPLTSIIWTLETLAERQSGGMSKEELGTVALAQQNAERMLHLADEILEIEKIDQGELHMSPRVIALPEVVERAIALNQGLALKHGVQIAATGLAAAEVRADPDRLLQVLSNLISNAAKHSPRDGRVGIAIEKRGEMFRVAVSDHGRGVPAQFREQLFGRFAQSSDGRALGGSGLGLAICKEIVERSGGAVGYDPNPSGGSVFWFDLPVVLTATLQPAAQGG